MDADSPFALEALYIYSVCVCDAIYICARASAVGIDAESDSNLAVIYFRLDAFSFVNEYMYTYSIARNFFIFFLKCYLSGRRYIRSID